MMVCRLIDKYCILIQSINNYKYSIGKFLWFPLARKSNWDWLSGVIDLFLQRLIFSNKVEEHLCSSHRIGWKYCDVIIMWLHTTEISLNIYTNIYIHVLRSFQKMNDDNNIHLLYRSTTIQLCKNAYTHLPLNFIGKYQLLWQVFIIEISMCIYVLCMLVVYIFWCRFIKQILSFLRLFNNY